MNEDEKVIGELTDAGIVAALSWAVTSAYARAWSDYDPETGHNQTVLGVTAHTLITNRQDRAFRLERYSAAEDDQDRDILLAGLLPHELDSLPIVSGVERSDLNNSPAWRHEHYRWFLTSFEHGKVHDIAWGRKSPTKKKIAAQAIIDNPEQFVLPGTYDQPVGHTLDPVTLRELLEANARDSLLSIVLAHSVNPHTGVVELFLGRPQLNVGGGKPWVWLRSLLAGEGAASVEARSDSQKQAELARGTEVPEAPVRLRPRVAGEEPGSQSEVR